MCLIAIKPRGVKVTEAWYKSLENGFAGNPDGAGFTIKQYKGVKTVYGYDLHKGTKADNFTLDYMLSLLQDTYKLDDEDEVMCHFRIRTVGKISQENCHPFIMDKTDIDNVDGFENKFPALAHNGGFDISAMYAGMSDTYTFVKDFASNKHNMTSLYREGAKFFKQEYSKLNNIGSIDLEHINIGFNKIGIMFPEHDRDIITVGSFVENPDTKCLYSHSGYSHSGYKSSFHRDYGGSSFGRLGDNTSYSRESSALSVVRKEPEYLTSNKKPFSMTLSTEYLKEIDEYVEAKKKVDAEEAERKKHKTSYQTKQKQTTQEHTDTRDTSWTNTIFINKENKSHFELKVKENFDLFDVGDTLIVKDYDNIKDEYHLKWKSIDGLVMSSVVVSRAELVKKSSLIIKPEFRTYYNEYFKLCNLVSRASKNVRKKLNRKIEEGKYKKKMFVRLQGFNNHELCDRSALEAAIARVERFESSRKNKFDKPIGNQLCLVN